MTKGAFWLVLKQNVSSFEDIYPLSERFRRSQLVFFSSSKAPMLPDDKNAPTASLGHLAIRLLATKSDGWSGRREEWRERRQLNGRVAVPRQNNRMKKQKCKQCGWSHWEPLASSWSHLDAPRCWKWTQTGALAGLYQVCVGDGSPCEKTMKWPFRGK